MDYARLKSSADGLIAKFRQGTTETGTATVTAGPSPLDDPTVTMAWVEFDATAFRGVSSQYLNDTTLLSSDLQAIIDADAPVVVGQQVRLDDVPHAVIRVDKIPASGVTVAKRIFVRA